MGRYVFNLPDIGEGIAEAEIVAWHVKVGDRVEEDGLLAEVMTDKATVEMESPVAGVVVEVSGVPGDRIAIGAPLVVIEREGAAGAEFVPACSETVIEGAGAVAVPAATATAGPDAVQALYAFHLPDIGEGIAEAEVVAWHVKVGDRIEEDGLLAEMMTDKATVEMESPVAGIVHEVPWTVGDKVAIGSPLVLIRIAAGDAACGSLERSHAAPLQKPGAVVEPRVAEASTGATSVQGGLQHIAAEGRVLAAPAVRARARALGIELASLSKDGAGIVRHEHLDAWLSRDRPSSPTDQGGLAGSKGSGAAVSGASEQIKIIGLRRRIAENMTAAKRHIPHFSYVEECDVTELDALRAAMNELRGDRTRLTLLPFLISAICRCLPDFPMINARFDDVDGVVTRYSAVHLGIATQTPAGLMVPVIRDAQNRDLGKLAVEISRLAEAARAGTAKPEELTGSTLTVTSLGPLGGIATTPVINRPEVAIIGPNRIVERPVYVSDGAGGEVLEKRKLMNVSISCDHRVVDGWDAASFMRALKGLIEAPMRLLAG